MATVRIKTNFSAYCIESWLRWEKGGRPRLYYYLGATYGQADLAVRRGIIRMIQGYSIQMQRLVSAKFKGKRLVGETLLLAGS